MPKEPQSSSSLSSKVSFFTYLYKNKRVLGTRETRYDAAVRTCRKIFPGIPADAVISFHTRELDACEGVLTEISERIWNDAVRILKSVTVVVEEKPVTHDGSFAPREDSSQKQTLKITAYLNYSSQETILKLKPHTRLEKIIALFAERTGHCKTTLRMVIHGRRIGPEKFHETVESIGLRDNDRIHLFVSQTGGKPIIYLFSPEYLDASVKLSLVPQWNFSAIYPVVPIKPKTAISNEEVSWRVQVHPNGELTELTTGIDVAYLFWEAHTDFTLPPSPPSPPIEAELGTTQVEAFNPCEAVLNDNNSVVMAVDKVTPYLDRTLKVLGLHTEARTSFITYWLPSLLKHKSVAFRFISQASYERAAPLQVIPSPDVVTRIFMIFQGVKENELDQWPTARAKAGESDVTWWRNVVGVDVDRTADQSLFRVLEWGGMEVLRQRSES